MMNKEKNFMSAVIYVHNAENSIEKFLNTIIEVLERNFEKSEIICVNDFSKDNSAEIIRKVSKQVQNTTVSVLNLSHYHGLELAMNAGVDLAIGDFVLEFDTIVLDFRATEVMNVYRKSLSGYDIVSASPDKKQKFTSSLFYKIFDKFAHLSSKIYTESFRILSRRVINRIDSMNANIPYRKVIYANCGLKTINIRYKVVADDGIYVVNKEERKYRTGLAMDTLILFTEVGYKFAVTMTVIMMVVAVLAGLYSVVVYIMGSPVAGWTTTILFLSFAFFGLFGALTIIIKYLQILVNLIFKKKQYNFESIEKLTK